MVVEQPVHMSLACWPATLSGMSRKGVWGVEPRVWTVQVEAHHSSLGPISAGVSMSQGAAEVTRVEWVWGAEWDVKITGSNGG